MIAAVAARSPRLSLVDELLGGEEARPALIEGDRHVSYRELVERVDARSGELDLPERSVVVLHGDTSLDYVVTYLALLRDDHVPLLAAQHAGRLADTWRPAALIEVDGTTVSLDRRMRPGAMHPDLHPDLALLLSTSGSTGSPKLVRLSHTNLIANARAIAEYLQLTADDRSITSLPLSYCYGLSVLHSHLVAGAGVVLTTASIVDPCFRRAAIDHGVTNIAGVPHTFELAERAGVDRLATPMLRFLTVAGGRMHPDAVVRWAERTESWGAELFVMYGQTEATARMAYLPPALARSHPDAIGLAIPGGTLRVDAPDGETGELVFRGPNVMMGYATDPTDLAVGASLAELRTGDLARHDPTTGLFSIVGRRSRFVKPFGLRIDLDTLQSDLAAELLVSDPVVAGDDERLAVAAPDADPAIVADWIAQRTGLAVSLVSVTDTAAPRTPSGKPDHAALLASTSSAAATAGASHRTVSAAFAAVLGRDAGPADTFITLGGDSLAYVECSIRLERVLGILPSDWHLLPVAELERWRRPDRGAERRPTWMGTARLDSTVLLRAIAICLIVATHMRVTDYPGGAHLLLALVGYNLSRFIVPTDDTRARVRAGLRTVWRTAGPVLAWVGAGMLLFGAYGAGTLLLVNNYVGPRHHRGDHWHFWFIEVLVHLTLLVTALLAIPAVRRIERRRPYAFVLGLLAVALVFRYGLVEILNPEQLRFRTHGVAWFFVLGWLVQRSVTRWQRLATSAIVVVTIDGFFGWQEREQFIMVSLVALVWFREITLPRLTVTPIALVSTASLWILITHFSVWPPLVDAVGRSAAYPITIASGVLVWMVVRVAGAGTRRLAGRAADRRVVARRSTIVRMA